MDDYEIKDILNRAKNPQIDIYLEITTEEKSESNSFLPKDPFNRDKKNKTYTEKVLEVFANNTGHVYANYLSCFFHVPSAILAKYIYLNNDKIKIDGVEHTTFYCDNTIRDVVDHKPIGVGFESIPKYGPSRYSPILPRLKKNIKSIILNDEIDHNDYKVFWQIYADNALPRDGNQNLINVAVIKIEKTI